MKIIFPYAGGQVLFDMLDYFRCVVLKGDQYTQSCGAAVLKHISMKCFEMILHKKILD